MQNINTTKPNYTKHSRNSFFPESYWLRSTSSLFKQSIGFVSYFNEINTFKGSYGFGVISLCRL